MLTRKLKAASREVQWALTSPFQWRQRARVELGSLNTTLASRYYFLAPYNAEYHFEPARHFVRMPKGHEPVFGLYLLLDREGHPSEDGRSAAQEARGRPE